MEIFQPRNSLLESYFIYLSINQFLFLIECSNFNAAVSGERFIAVDITFRNTAGPEKHQAVALRNSADLSTFYRCSFEGYQDTLYVHTLRQFYKQYDIYWTLYL